MIDVCLLLTGEDTGGSDNITQNDRAFQRSTAS